jgi:hypothetical protein
MQTVLFLGILGFFRNAAWKCMGVAVILGIFRPFIFKEKVWLFGQQMKKKRPVWCHVFGWETQRGLNGPCDPHGQRHSGNVILLCIG